MDQAKELLEMPREFVKDGRQFLTRCSKRTPLLPSPSPALHHPPTVAVPPRTGPPRGDRHHRNINHRSPTADQHPTPTRSAR